MKARMRVTVLTAAILAGGGLAGAPAAQAAAPGSAGPAGHAASHAWYAVPRTGGHYPDCINVHLKPGDNYVQ